MDWAFPIFWLVMALLVGFLADWRGRSGIGFALLSLLFTPVVGLIFVMALKNLNEDAFVTKTPNHEAGSVGGKREDAGEP